MSKFEVEKFNDKENFGLWQKMVKALLMQKVFRKTLHGKSIKLADMSDEDWEEMDLKATCTIQLYLTDEVMYNVMDEETATRFMVKIKNVEYDKDPLQNWSYEDKL